MASWYDHVVTGAAKMEALYAELFEAAGAGRRWGEILASRQGLTQAQWQTLWIAAVGPLTVPQIARRLGVSRQNVQRVANDLAAAGMATFRQNPDHKSSPLLDLTPAGRRALDRINTAAAGYNQALLERLSEPGIDELRRLVTSFSQAVHEFIDAARQPGE
jgi:DNA-binding MarR family transcriptional regulator